jgi:hypothetical protein
MEEKSSKKKDDRVFSSSGEALAANYFASSTTSRKKKRVLSAFEQNMQRMVDEIEMSPAKRIACTNEALFIIRTILEIQAVCQPTTFQKTLETLENQIPKLRDVDGLRGILDYWFRSVTQCICIKNANMDKMKHHTKTLINHIVMAMIEAYPDLIHRLIASSNMEEYRHNCDAIAEYFHERPHVEPVMCSEMER